MLQFKYRLYIHNFVGMTISYAVSSSFLGIFRSKIEVLPRDHFVFFFLSFCQFYVNIDTMLIFRSIRHSKLLLHIENGLLEWWMNGWMDGSVLRYVYTRDHFKDIADCWMRCRRRQSSGDGEMHYLYILLFFITGLFVVFFFCLKFYHSILKMPPNKMSW